MDTKKAGLPALLPELQEAWNKLVAVYAADRTLTDHLLEEIIDKYTARSRHYHNLHHITALLQLSGQFSAQLVDKEVVDWSIFYHDIIYKVSKKDNEHQSALLAQKRLQALGVPPSKIVQVGLFIEATKTHQLPEGAVNPTDLQLFLDFDMSILAASWGSYLEYTRQVRKEYRLFPNKLYKPGRRQFLQHCLQAPHIFHTTVFRDQYEAIARGNIKQELELLG